ncbi:MAG: prolyl-tRNA synthetase associated domain-containing protein [Pseudomonadota bacterium]
MRFNIERYGLQKLAEHLTPAELLDYLVSLGIPHKTFAHPPVYTVEEAKRLRGSIDGAHTKNLFLRNKKGRMFLVTCLENRTLDLKALSARIGTRSLSFCKRERLDKYLGVIPGAVTPFAVVNDRNRAVTLILDDALRVATRLNFHPLDNARTTSISPEGLLRFLEATDHPPQWVDLSSEYVGVPLEN